MHSAGATIGRVTDSPETVVGRVLTNMERQANRLGSLNERLYTALARMHGAEPEVATHAPGNAPKRLQEAAGAEGSLHTRINATDDLLDRLAHFCDRLDRVV